MPDNFNVVLNTCPDKDTANKIAASLVEKRLCACVNIIPGIESVYRWKGKVETDKEHLLIIKSTKEAYPYIEKHIQDNHPYELPEIIAVSLENGLPGYLSWIDENITKHS